MDLNYYIVDQSITSQGALQGPADTPANLANLSAADSNGLHYLVFALLENTGSNPTTNSGVGIDNIKITANVASVPVPAAIWTFLSGFIGLLALGRRKHHLA